MNSQSFEIVNDKALLEKMLYWANRYSIFCFLNGNGYTPDRSFPVLLAVGAKSSVALSAGNAFAQLKSFHDENPGWLFGHLGYSLMEETLQIKSQHPRKAWFHDAFFFQPEILIKLSANAIEIEAADPIKVFADIMHCADHDKQQAHGRCEIQNRMSQVDYLESLLSIRSHLQAGDCYELNYCQEFYAENIALDPINTYLMLMDAAPNPFSALYKNKSAYCISASPERFLQKKGNRVISQPMKGTIKREADPAKDELNRLTLVSSEKDKSENVMVVDLVRNDLSKFCKEGSVQVPELFGVYSYPLVHQMISTVEGLVDNALHWTEIIRHCFPMGSMTGAPKKRVAELIDQYEKTERGLFSGSIGYVNNEGDVDFNVLIRSVFYDAGNEKLHFLAGGGITIHSDPEAEYEESCLKAKAIIKVLSE